MSNGIVIECKFEISHDVYTCIVQNETLITSSENREITGIRGEHLSGKSNDDVSWFCAEDKMVKFFPQNLTKYFKNIESVTIFNGNLQKITKEDLKEFGDKLKYLYCRNNAIEVLDADLFEFNRNMEKICFHFNEIKKIEAKTFNGLEKLESLQLNNNPCTSGSEIVKNNRPKVLKLIKRIEINSNDPIIASKNMEIFSLRSKLKSTLKDLNEKNYENEKLNAKVSGKKFQITKLEEKVKILEEKLYTFLAKTYQEKDENIKNLIDGEIEKFTKNLNDLTSKLSNNVKNLVETRVSSLSTEMDLHGEKRKAENEAQNSESPKKFREYFSAFS